MTTLLALCGAAAMASSGPIAAAARRVGPRRADRLWVLLFVVGASLAAFAALLALASGGDELRAHAPFPVGEVALGLDALSALFLIAVAGLGAACACYGLAYYPAALHPDSAGRLRTAFGLASAGLAMVLLARHSLVFIAAWETMAVSSYFAVAAEDRDREVREAGFLYLVSTRVSSLCLIALFALHWAASGSLLLVPLGAGQIAPQIQSALFVLALLGFGLKAGLVPLHVWLPPAHSAAPTHVSALLSGVLIKSGIYGLVRITSLLPEPSPWWGEMVLALGVVSAVLGVAYALAQHDLKRLLAYHSVENIGIIAIGLGVALIARASAGLDTAALALAGALLHVVNHALFKGLLFLAAGAVIQRAHTRSLDALGGLGRSMPATALLFLLGAVAIVGLPPLNGFVSELLIYSSLLRMVASEDGASWISAALAAPALALTGGLALACFAKAFGTVFLGAPRHQAVSDGSDAPAAMRAPMVALALGCAFIGLAPFALAPALRNACEAVLGSALAPLAAPWRAISGVALASLALSAAGGAWLWLRLSRRPAPRTVTWDCGYAAPTQRMQYSAASFAQPLVRVFSSALLPREYGSAGVAPFPQRSAFHSEVVDAALDRIVLPSAHAVVRLAARLRVLQQGSVQQYLVYVWIAVIALLAVGGVGR